ncbi:MAG: GTP-binding protein [Cyanobacteria bacterium J06627_32]
MALIPEGHPSEAHLSKDDSAIKIPKKGMPVTIITGFLGSGKTTLLNHILNNAQGLKVAVLVNEFGDINIDAQLIVSTQNNMVELSNGCICCTINDSLVDSVYQVLEREERMDYLVIETTGLADPLPIMMTFVGTSLRDFTRLDSVLGVVDVDNFGADLSESSVYENQLIYSDIILLNKTDLVSAERLQSIESEIHSLKDGARMLRCSLAASPETAAALPLSAILDVGLADAETYRLSERELSEHMVSDRFVSIPFRSDRPFDFTKFEHFLMQQLPSNIFRAKGILWFEDQPQRYIFQLSGKRCNLSPDSQQRPSQNQLVLIGRQLNPLQLHQQLNNCLTS